MGDVLTRSFFLNVLAGVIATIVFALLTWFAARVAQARGLGPRRIDGEWDYYYVPINDSDRAKPRHAGKVVIRQLWGHVRLEITVERRRDGREYDRGRPSRYKGSGRWTHDELLVRFMDVDARHRIGSLVMHWHSGEIVGRSIYVENDPVQVESPLHDKVTVHGIKFSGRRRR